MEGEIDEKDVKKNEGEHHENGDDILLLVEFNDENKLLRILGFIVSKVGKFSIFPDNIGMINSKITDH